MNIIVEKMVDSNQGRLFPGPAGILQGGEQNALRSELIESNPNWKRMVGDRTELFAGSETGPCAVAILEKFNIKWFTELKSSSEICKAPLMTVVVKSLSPCILMDESGYLYGMLDSNVEVVFGPRLKPGSGKNQQNSKQSVFFSTIFR